MSPRPAATAAAPVGRRPPTHAPASRATSALDTPAGTRPSARHRLQPRRLLTALLAIAATGLGFAQGAETDRLLEFLSPLQEYPTVRAAREQVRSARLSLDAAYDPVSLSASGAFNAFATDAIDIDAGSGDQGLPATASSLSAALTFRPFAFGDVADQADQRRIELRQARLDADAGLAQVEVQALDAAFAVVLAERSLATAQQGARLADQALASTRTRFDNGAANAREVREAETGAAEAHSFVANAQGSVSLARLSLSSLVGDTAPPDLDVLELPMPSGVPAAVRRARLGAALVEVGIRSARRSVYPVAQASYSWNLDDHSTVGLTLESRTLQPTLNYAYSEPGTSFPQNAVNGTFSIAVSAKLSPGVFQGLAATDARLRAANDSVEAAERGAVVQEAALDNDLAQAQRTLAVARRKLSDASATLREASRREALGLDIPLVTQRASLERTRQALAVQQARQGVFDMTLAYYGFYAVPLSSTLHPAQRDNPTTAPEAHP